MKIYAFEWCYCVIESGFSPVSLHTTKRGAFKAMTTTANARALEARKRDLESGYSYWKPLQYEAWRIKGYEVIED